MMLAMMFNDSQCSCLLRHVSSPSIHGVLRKFSAVFRVIRYNNGANVLISNSSRNKTAIDKLSVILMPARFQSFRNTDCAWIFSYDLEAFTPMMEYMHEIVLHGLSCTCDWDVCGEGFSRPSPAVFRGFLSKGEVRTHFIAVYSNEETRYQCH